MAIADAAAHHITRVALSGDQWAVEHALPIVPLAVILDRDVKVAQKNVVDDSAGVPVSWTPRAAVHRDCTLSTVPP